MDIKDDINNIDSAPKKREEENLNLNLLMNL